MTDPRVRRVRIAAAGAAAATLLLAAPAGAAELPKPTVTTADGQSVIKFLSHTTDETFTPKGGKPQAGDPQKKPEVGDAFGFNDSNSQDGTKVGTDHGDCTVTVSGEKSVTSHCVVTVKFVDGTISGEGDTVFTEDGSTPFTIPIKGGTGAYAGAHGTAKVAEVNDKDSNLTLTYRTSGAPAGDSGGQVSATPVGGANAGGGSMAGGQGSSLLALGGLGMAAGAGLLAAGRRSGRRTS